jgi:hypothetical protein
VAWNRWIRNLISNRSTRDESDSCLRVETLLADFARGDLPPDSAGMVEAHLSACALCRAALQWRQLTRHAVAHRAVATPPFDLQARILAAIHDGAAPVSPRAPWWVAARPALAAACTVAIVAAGIGIYLHGAGNSHGTVTARLDPTAPVNPSAPPLARGGTALTPAGKGPTASRPEAAEPQRVAKSSPEPAREPEKVASGPEPVAPGPVRTAGRIEDGSVRPADAIRTRRPEAVAGNHGPLQTHLVATMPKPNPGQSASPSSHTPPATHAPAMVAHEGSHPAEKPVVVAERPRQPEPEAPSPDEPEHTAVPESPAPDNAVGGPDTNIHMASMDPMTSVRSRLASLRDSNKGYKFSKQISGEDYRDASGEGSGTQSIVKADFKG